MTFKLSPTVTRTVTRTVTVTVGRDWTQMGPGAGPANLIMLSRHRLQAVCHGVSVTGTVTPAATVWVDSVMMVRV